MSSEIVPDQAGASIPRGVREFIVSTRQRHAATVYSFDPSSLEAKYQSSIFKVYEDAKKDATATTTEPKEAKETKGNGWTAAASGGGAGAGSKNVTAASGGEPRAAGASSILKTSASTKSIGSTKSTSSATIKGKNKGNSNGRKDTKGRKKLTRKEKRLMGFFGPIQRAQIIDTASKRFLAEPKTLTITDKATWAVVRQTFREYLIEHAPKNDPTATAPSRLNRETNKFMDNLVRNRITRERIRAGKV